MEKTISIRLLNTYSQEKNSARRLLSVLVLAAFAIRLVVVCFTYGSLPYAEEYMSHAQFGYEMGWIARALASGHGFSSPYYPWSGATAMQPPLYPFLLSLVFRIFGIYTVAAGFAMLTVNSLLSALTCIPVYFSAKFSLGCRGARIAAGVWAFYPFAIYFSAGRVWEYSLTGLLFATCFCIAQRIHNSAKPLAWLGWGALYGVTALSNPAVLSTLPFLLLLAVGKVRQSGGRWLRNGALTMLAAIAVLAPWTVPNTGSVPLILSDVQASCGCTTPSWSKEPVMPGAKGYITATYNPKGEAGRFDKTITVKSNANDDPVNYLKISGEVVPKEKTIDDVYKVVYDSLRFSEANVTFKLTVDKTDSKKIEVFNPSNIDINLTFPDLPKHLTVVANPQTLKPKQKGTILITYNASIKKDFGFVTDVVNIAENKKIVKTPIFSANPGIFQKISQK